MKTPFAPTVLALAMLAPLAAWSQISISIGFAPPPLPVYSQPPVPGDGYLWTPGYWAWNGADDGYYWVPGTWVLAPTPGFLWTPGYWGYRGGGYRWTVGYWGPSVGFYGGIVYGHGYNGHGYEGGRWQGGAFHYNTAVNNVNTTVVHNVYNVKVINKTVNTTRVSYNGGASGVRAQPTAVEERVRHEKRIDATPNQVEHERTAMQAPAQKASVNHGVPQVAATRRPAAFDAPSAVGAVNPAPTTKADLPAAPRGERQARTTAAPDKAGNDANARGATRPMQSDAQGAAPQATPEARPARSEPRQTNAGQSNRPDAPTAAAKEPQAQQDRPQQTQGERGANGKSSGNGKGGAPANVAPPRPEAEPRSKGQSRPEAGNGRARGDAQPNGKQRE